MSAHIRLALSMSYFLAFKKLQFQNGTNSTAVKDLHSLEWYPNSLHSHTLKEKNLQGDNYNPGGNNKGVETLNGC